MVSQNRSWWQKNRKPLIIVAVIAAIVVTVVLIFVVVGFYGTGFDGYNKITTARTIGGPSSGAVIRTEEYQPGKTLWDWMSLLILPVILALVGFFFTRTERRNEQAIAIDNQQEAALQGYLDRMSALLLEKNLRESKLDDEVRTIARVRTLIMLCQLNTRRINYMLVFLRESKLITDDMSTNILTFSKANLSNVYLQGVDFHSIDLNYAKLSGANLGEANLSGADLGRAFLSKAYLHGANLYGANLGGANLYGANLGGANLGEANLGEANLSEANLSGANLSKAYLSKAYLSEANLYGAKLQGADLSEADLYGVNLQGADLSKAYLSKANLSEAKYNTKVIHRPLELFTIGPTRWPQGFDPKAAGAICVDY
jgi:uncharacterized protein YjbI with pentapeptide repeats